MRTVDFVTLGDEAYFATVQHSLARARELYPASDFHVYDWGLSAEQREGLAAGGAHLVPWADRRPRSGDVPGLPAWKRAIHGYLLGSKLHRKEERRLLLEFLYCDKVHCLLDLAVRSPRPFVYLDGDAFLLNRIDELLEEDAFDVGLTLRRRSQLESSLRRGHHPINAGVIFLFGTLGTRIAFLIEWLREIEYLLFANVALAEQTALSTLLAKRLGDGFVTSDEPAGLLQLGDARVRVKVLPSELYNYTWVEEGLDRDAVRIVHLKSGRELERHLPLLGRPRPSS